MTSEAIQANINFSLSATQVLPTEHTKGSETQRTKSSIGADLALSTTLLYYAAGTPANTTPYALRMLRGQATIASSEATIDLTAAPVEGAVSSGARALNEDLSGKKLLTIFLKAASGNAAAIVVKPHATNGYNLFGTASDQVTMQPDQTLATHVNDDSLDDVGATDKIIHFTGTDGDVIDYMLLFSP